MKCQAQLGGPLLDIVRRHPSSAHRYAFTRVELIVLTLILALLAPMFCATLSLSKKHVGRTCCYNNLRRLAQASAMYAHDNLGYMAYPNWGAPPWPGWLYTPTNGQPPDPGPGGAYATNENPGLQDRLVVPVPSRPQELFVSGGCQPFRQC